MSSPFYRLAFDAAELLREHPPQFKDPHKVRLFEIAYPLGTAPAGTVEVTRWACRSLEPLMLSEPIAPQVQPNYYDYVAARCGSPCPLPKLVGRVALLGLRWGTSDGN